MNPVGDGTTAELVSQKLTCRARRTRNFFDGTEYLIYKPAESGGTTIEYFPVGMAIECDARIRRSDTTHVWLRFDRTKVDFRNSITTADGLKIPAFTVEKTRQHFDLKERQTHQTILGMGHAGHYRTWLPGQTQVHHLRGPLLVLLTTADMDTR